MAPTRELSQQIYSEAKKFSKTCGVQVSALLLKSASGLFRRRLWRIDGLHRYSRLSPCQVAGVYGGASKNEQRLDLLRGAEIMVSPLTSRTPWEIYGADRIRVGSRGCTWQVGTPGRLIDMLRSKVRVPPHPAQPLLGSSQVVEADRRRTAGESHFWYWTRQTACSTWALRHRSAACLGRSAQIARRSCFRRLSRSASASSPILFFSSPCTSLSAPSARPLQMCGRLCASSPRQVSSGRGSWRHSPRWLTTARCLFLWHRRRLPRS